MRGWDDAGRARVACKDEVDWEEWEDPKFLDKWCWKCVHEVEKCVCD